MLAALPPQFAGLEPADSQEAASFLKSVRVEAGQAIMLEGEEDTTVAFIVSGTAEIWSGDTKIGTAGTRDILGEVELFSQLPRVASVTAQTPCQLLVLEPEDYLELCDRGNPVVYGLERGAIRRISERLRGLTTSIVDHRQGSKLRLEPAREGVFKRLAHKLRPEPTPDIDAAAVLSQSELFSWAPADAIVTIADLCEPVSFPAETILCRQGEDANCAWILESGRVEVVLLTDGEERAEHVAYIKPGQMFGDTSVALGTPRSATCVSRADLVALELEAATCIELYSMNEIPGSVFRQAMVRNLIAQLQATSVRFVALQRGASAEEDDVYKGTPVSNVWRD